MVDLYRRVLAEFAVIGISALASLREREPSRYNRLMAYSDRLSARDKKRLAADRSHTPQVENLARYTVTSAKNPQVVPGDPSVELPAAAQPLLDVKARLAAALAGLSAGTPWGGA